MPKTIVLVATLDTKGDLVQYVKERIEKQNFNTIVIDPGVMNTPLIKADITREEVARRGGKELSELVEAAKRGADRSKATEVMIKGVIDITRELYEAGRLDGILSIGGSTGQAIGTAAMETLPVGVPKLMVFGMGGKDITRMPAVSDVLGLNRVTGRILSNAAGAIVGMVEMETPERKSRPLIGLTSYGVTTPCVINTKTLLDENGYESIAFSVRAQMLEEMITQGTVDALIDITPAGIYESWYDLPLAQPNRMESAGLMGIPQIIVPGSLDFINFGRMKVPSEFMDRVSHKHGPHVTLVKTTKEEVFKAGTELADRANRSRGPVAFVIPLNGFSASDIPPYYDRETDLAFGEAVRETANSDIQVVEVEAHINEEKFANRLFEVFIDLLKE